MRDPRALGPYAPQRLPSIVDLIEGRQAVAAPAMVQAAAPQPSVASRIAGMVGGGVGALASIPFLIPQAAAARLQQRIDEGASSRQRLPLELEQARLANEAAQRQAQLEQAQLPAQQAVAAAQARQQAELAQRIGAAPAGRERDALIRGAATGTFRPFELEPGPAELAAYQQVLGMQEEEARQKLIGQREQRQAQLEAQLQRQTTRERLGGEFELERAKRTLGPKAPDLTDVAGIRKEFASASKDYVTVRDATARIQASAQDPSPAGDLALIFSFMRALDPGSTVREGEFANAQNAASVPERIRGMYNRVANGERLTEEQRADFLQQGMTLYQAQEQTHQATRAQFEAIAARSGIDPRDVVDAVPGLPTPKAPRKMINGAEYEKVDGGWKLVEK